MANAPVEPRDVGTGVGHVVVVRDVGTYVVETVRRHGGRHRRLVDDDHGDASPQIGVHHRGSDRTGAPDDQHRALIIVHHRHRRTAPHGSQGRPCTGEGTRTTP